MAKNEIETRGNNPIAIMRNWMQSDAVIKRIEEAVGERKGVFMNSVLNLMLNDNKLQKCTQQSILAAALIPATLNLPIEKALKQAAIVPYGNQATFQIMWRGLVQLCLRTGEYKAIHCSEIYRDELMSHNPITGEVKFHDPSTYKLRYKKKDGDVVGHYIYFRLLTGFEKSDYMTCEEAIAHAKKFSKAYQYDLRKNKKDSPWSTDPIPMGNKTVLLRLLGAYGPSSVEVHKAISAQLESFEEAQARSDDEVDAKTGKKHVDVKMTDTEPPEPEEPDGENPEFMEGADDPDTKAKAEKQKADLAAAEAGKTEGEKVWECKSCYRMTATGKSIAQPKRHYRFAEPVLLGKKDHLKDSCPKCFCSNIVNHAAFTEATEPE